METRTPSTLGLASAVEGDGIGGRRKTVAGAAAMRSQGLTKLVLVDSLDGQATRSVAHGASSILRIRV